MLFLYRFFCGILEVEFSGIYPEKILNLCAQNKIGIWNTRFLGQKIRLFITVIDFKKLPKILKKSGIKVHILRKKGFPFFINKYKKRFGIFAGIVLFFAVLQFMSGFIWIIEVQGTKTVETTEIISVCSELGIKIGTKSNSIDTKNVPQNLLLKMDELSWGSFNIEGCKLTVNVSEVTPKKEDNSVATNLKASADGVIKKIDVTSGNCVVKVGDIVKKGDVLVSGIIENANETKFVHSIGSIIAETQETVSFSEPFLKKVKYPLGKHKKKSVLEIFTLKIPLYIGKQKGSFETQIEHNYLELFSQKLPIVLHTKKFQFVKKETKKQSYSEVCDILENRLIVESKDNNYIIKSKELSRDEDGVTLKAVICKTGDITYSENIIFTIGN